MNLSNYKRRIQRLERILSKQPLRRKIRYGTFVLYTLPLRKGAVVPSGSRVVRDFFPFIRAVPGARGFVCGYYRERITADPADNGVVHDSPESPGESEDP